MCINVLSSYYIQMCWKQLAITFICLVALDVCYLTVTKDLMSVQIASVQRVALQPRMIGAIVCYLLIAAGLWYFILRDRRSPWEAMLLGVVIYGVFDSTNYAIFKNWKWQVALLDTLWGGVLFAMTTMAVYWISSK